MAAAMRMPYQRTVSGPRWKAMAPGEANTESTIPRRWRRAARDGRRRERSGPVVEPRGGELRLEGRAHQERHERTRSRRLRAARGEARPVDGDLLQLRGQRPDHDHALDRSDLADLVHHDLGLAARHLLGRT